MPINEKLNIAFIHIPKTAGTSIESFFDMHHKKRFFQRKHVYTINGIRYCMQHLPYQQLQKRAKTDLNDLFTFSCVRNPYDRVISEYFYKNTKKKFNNKEFNKWLKKHLKSKDEDHNLPQHKFICDKEDNILVDYLIYFENLNNDLSKLLDKLNMNKNKDLKFLKKSQNRNSKKYDDYLNQEQKKMISNKYKKDFEIFGYSYD